MARDEFSIIKQYFSDIGIPQAGTVLGIGDDAAVLELAQGRQLVVSTDTLISGVHFPLETSAADIAAKALAVNLSDLAAMAADPAWFFLSLTLPQADENWLQDFAESLDQIACRYGVQLVGGDTCRGQLAIGIQVTGQVPSGRYLTRAGASEGDLILVSGELGNAALGLAQLQNKIELPDHLRDRCISALNRPQPRLELGAFLRDVATAAIDISDGLQADLSHILQASGCGARILGDQLPMNDWIKQRQWQKYVLQGGDDYEICCCVPAKWRARIDEWNREHDECKLSVIGKITSSGYLLQDHAKSIDLAAQSGGYRHFD